MNSEHRRRRDAQAHAAAPAAHQSASKAPRRRAMSRYTIMIASGTSDSAAASGKFGHAEVGEDQVADELGRR